MPVLLVEDNENNHHHDVHSDEKPHDKKYSLAAHDNNIKGRKSTYYHAPHYEEDYLPMQKHIVNDT